MLFGNAFRWYKFTNDPNAGATHGMLVGDFTLFDALAGALTFHEELAGEFVLLEEAVHA